ncbi:MAG: phosphate acyltransferase PlsX [Paratractidigestivibacter faecalis]|uniref:phosphate acyltransferase PlsX n=1 Tax=Paratractidigestivibacter faecalis TaxID=2292441 RepID=UPI0026EBB785|nr:phosphate acyltransferase PlsX [Paratractidigestivibacter faecalis]MDD6417118.1 phosphate acyltransferase PlsX [Paratractidigestivibacter faecalis]
MTTICVDVMGADKEPEVLLKGVTCALEKDPDLCVLLAGSAGVVEPYCASHERARALVTTEVIGMAEHPASAVRQKKDASIVRAAAAVRAGEADGLFSAGSTGAVLTAATFGVGRIKGVKRPALSLPFPGLGSHKTIFLDMGANADVKPEVMVQFAHMGRAFAEVALGVSDARVGLLCNGSEDTKGSEMALAYHEALANGSCGFAGNAEGTDVLGDRFDVIVCDGFTGNVCLKTIEGTGKFVLSRVKAAMKGSLGAKLGAALLAGPLKAMAGELSGAEYGGAILLGLRAPVVKGHGATSAEAVCAGTLSCAAYARANLCEKIAQACEIAG